MKQNETIAAISTPLAPGGIGMIRISGPEAFAVGDRVFRGISGKALAQHKGYTGAYGTVWDQEGKIDEAVAFVYRAPASYTGENVVELCCHGGVYLVKRCLRACLDAGARLAEAGEFTKRAFLNGKMELTQAEAVMDLIAAQGSYSARAALSARDGAVYRRIHGVSQELLGLSAALAAWTDYPDEDLEELSDNKLEEGLAQAEKELQKLLRDYDSGRLLREGVDTVIVGRPNVGKSTLMNLLSGTQKSIVTQIPGTTRDVVEETIQLGDVTLRLADTAGLRSTNDPVEKLGVQLARERLERSTLVLAVFDSSDPLTPEDRELIQQVKERPVIAIINKTDLERSIQLEEIRRDIPRVVELSAAAGDGLDRLSDAVFQLLCDKGLSQADAVLANERQRQCAQESLNALEEALLALRAGETLDAVGVCIDEAIDGLLALTGEKATQAVVDEVFSRFCVGK